MNVIWIEGQSAPVFLAAYTAVNDVNRLNLADLDFLAAYTAVNVLNSSTETRGSFLAAYTAVNCETPP